MSSQHRSFTCIIFSKEYVKTYDYNRNIIFKNKVLGKLTYCRHDLKYLHSYVSKKFPNFYYFNVYQNGFYYTRVYYNTYLL